MWIAFSFDLAPSQIRVRAMRETHAVSAGFTKYPLSPLTSSVQVGADYVQFHPQISDDGRSVKIIIYTNYDSTAIECVFS
jgi:hypothetical protein